MPLRASGADAPAPVCGGVIPDRIARRGLVFILSITLTIVLSACSGCRILVPDDGTVTVVSWNVENLFDETGDGTEYPEFRPDAGWDREDVADRLRGVAEVLAAIDPPPDILVLVEIENEVILNRLLDNYVVDVPLPYRCFIRGPDGATGVSVSSRYPIRDARALLARADAVPPQRPVLETRISLPTTELVVFANHWKSKRGSAAATEPLRRAAARLLSARMRALTAAEPGLPIIVAGDLNEQGRELSLVEAAYPTALMETPILDRWDHQIARGEPGPPSWYDARLRAAGEFLPLVRDVSLLDDAGSAVLYDPWETCDSEGSYWFYGRWEQIDHILLNGPAARGPGIWLEEFRPVRPAASVDAEGRPMSWEDGGVSDHLPVIATFARPGE